MIEFVIGLIGLLVAAVAVLTIGILAKEDTESFREAQKEAIDGSMSAGFADSFSPRSDNDPGADNRNLTKDDKPVSGLLGNLRMNIAAEGMSAGTVTRANGEDLHHNTLQEFASGEREKEAFSFRKGEESRTIEVTSAASVFFGFDGTAEVKNEVWMPQTGGLY
ncbi:MAG: hypothetical protein ACI4QT_11035 [Kiritimatiellia bacterium]